MRIVVQRVSEAKVIVEGQIISEINTGLLILLGIEVADTDEDIEWLVKKILNIRIFPDENGIMNRSVTEINGDIAIVSQFTLHANIRKGNRPSYIRASK